MCLRKWRLFSPLGMGLGKRDYVLLFHFSTRSGSYRLVMGIPSSKIFYLIWWNGYFIIKIRECSLLIAHFPPTSLKSIPSYSQNHQLSLQIISLHSTNPILLYFKRFYHTKGNLNNNPGVSLSRFFKHQLYGDLSRKR